MEATLQQFDALRSPGRTIRGHVDRLAPRMMAEMRVLKMRQCCKVRVNNSLIQARGLSARHCRPSPAPRRRRKFIGTPHYFCPSASASHQDRVPLDRRPALFGVSFVARHGTKRSVGERVSVEQLTEAPGNSKNSTTFCGRLQKTLFPRNLDHAEVTCLALVVDLLIPRPS